MIGIKKKEDIFYKMFVDFAGKIILAGEAFQDLVHNYENVDEKVANMKVLETECDMETHKILKSLHESFITPFDREDIYAITREMDSIVDCMEEVANRFQVFEVKVIKPEAVVLTDMILQSIRELETMFRHLAEMKKNSIVMEQIIEVNRIENEGDVVFRKALSTLFREEKDPIELIKWKHLYEQIEESIDSCENVANILEGVVMKYA
ncbi:MAG: DUF47 family protein [Eubacteriales bacterium]|nr:DUF47 family protein [Eubacteriales bacterium]NLF47673.1 DUF47 domain-containing protein [Clostridiales bacterium]